MTHIICRLTDKNRDQLRNPMLGNRVWASFTFYTIQIKETGVSLGRHCYGYYIIICFLALGSIWSWGMTEIRSITKYHKISWNDLPPHQQSSHEAELHWSIESTRSTAEKESCLLKSDRKLRQSVDQDQYRLTHITAIKQVCVQDYNWK